MCPPCGPPPGFAPRSAHASTIFALELVQHAPSCRPTNALIAAAEFTYVIGVIGTSACSSRIPHASSSWSISAMSAMLHPADRSGRITRCRGPVKMSAVSAMKCTPQNTM